MRVNLRNELGQIKQAKVGFSWTMFFFNSFVPLFRGDWKVAGIMWGVWFVSIFVLPYLAMSWSLVGTVFSFFYNKVYINGLISKGFKPATDSDRDILLQKGFIV